MGGQSGEFFGHIDANGKSSGFCQGAVFGNIGRHGAARQGHGLVPTVNEALALLFNQKGQQGRRLFCQSTQLSYAILQHVGQTCTFSGSGVFKRFNRLCGQGHEVCLIQASA